MSKLETAGGAKRAAGAAGRAAAGAMARAGEPSWLAEFRAHGRESYEATDLPHRALHLWRYTDPEVFLPATDPFAPPFVEVAEAGWPAALQGSLEQGEIAGAAVWHAGRLERVELTEDVRRAGVLLLDLEEAARTHPERLERVLGRLVGPEHGKFEALNAAGFRGGVFLHVPRGVEVEKPIHLVQSFGDGAVAFSRLAVLLEEGSSITLIEELLGGPASGLQQLYGVSEVEVGAGARLQVVTIQNLAGSVRGHLTQRARLDRNASIVPVIASFGGSLVKTDTGALLEGEGSQSEMTGFLSAVGRKKFDHHTLHRHVGRHTRSNLEYKTVLKDRSRSAYTGLIRIEPEASFSQAYQENRNLLLNENCRADSIPELEIMTEEVQCTHGATVGPVDRDHLFYLMSRSIPRSEAVRMIVEGHFDPTLRRLPAGLQDRLRGVLRERLA